MSTFRAMCSLYLVMALGVMADGWSTNIWPSQEHPMEAWRQLQECYTATVERCSVAAVTAPASITNYMRGYQALTNLKSRLAAAIPAFVDPANKPYTNYFATYTNATTLPLLTATGLLTSCQLPTNYFAYTPYLNLSGLGPCTNDTSTPYPHGFTNAYTIAGGSNFPSGRSTWYDTDYGIAAFTTLCSRITDIKKTPSATIQYAGTSQEGGYWAKTNTYAAIVAGIDAYFTTNSAGLYDILVFGEGSRTQNWAPYNNISTKSQVRWSYNVTNLYTNTSVSVEWFINVKLPSYYLPDGTSTFANTSFAFTENIMNSLSSETVDAGTASIVSPAYGTTNGPCGIGMPDFPSAYPAHPWFARYGWEFKDTHLVVFSYDFTFK